MQDTLCCLLQVQPLGRVWGPHSPRQGKALWDPGFSSAALMTWVAQQRGN